MKRKSCWYCIYQPIAEQCHAMFLQTTKHMLCAYAQRRRPRRPPFLRVESEGVGVTSSMRPMRIPARARARRADWAPGPGVLVPLPPVARILTWRAEIPSSLQRAAGIFVSLLIVLPMSVVCTYRRPGQPTWRRRGRTRHGRP